LLLHAQLHEVPVKEEECWFMIPIINGVELNLPPEMPGFSEFHRVN
jgi:hypothetical protein